MDCRCDGKGECPGESPADQARFQSQMEREMRPSLVGTTSRGPTPPIYDNAEIRPPAPIIPTEAAPETREIVPVTRYRGRDGGTYGTPELAAASYLYDIIGDNLQHAEALTIIKKRRELQAVFDSLDLALKLEPGQ
jgi:hypothetical protein